MSNTEPLIEAIIQARERRGWTRYRLAKEAGLNDPTIKYLEEQTRTPDLRTLTKVAEALDLKLHFLPSGWELVAIGKEIAENT